MAADLSFVLELVQRLAQPGLGVGAFELGGEHFQALHIDSLGQQLIAWLEASLLFGGGSSFSSCLTWSAPPADANPARRAPPLRVWAMPCTGRLQRLQIGQRVVARHGLDTADAGRHAAFGHDLERPMSPVAF